MKTKRDSKMLREGRRRFSQELDPQMSLKVLTAGVFAFIFVIAFAYNNFYVCSVSFLLMLACLLSVV